MGNTKIKIGFTEPLGTSIHREEVYCSIMDSLRAGQ
ncbi:hypothetical protein J6I75_08655 [Pseudidiomarina sp. 1APP75-27a]|nr:hypothetical protein [Pseudidiomarina sp. 1APP75-27a]